MNKKTNILYISILSVILLLLIILIKTNYINNIDSIIYNLLTNNINDVKTWIFKVITFFGSPIFIIAIIVLSLIIFRKSRRGVRITIVIIITTLVNNIIKWIMARPRPNINRIVSETGYSFPSGHTMAITALSGVLIYELWNSNLTKSTKIVLTVFLSIMVVLVMVSRIYLGVHYFSDVIGGLITSLIILNVSIPLLDQM